MDRVLESDVLSDTDLPDAVVEGDLESEFCPLALPSLAGGLGATAGEGGALGSCGFGSGTTSTIPGQIECLGSLPTRGFALSSFATVVPFSLAILLRLSPFLTLYGSERLVEV